MSIHQDNPIETVPQRRCRTKGFNRVVFPWKPQRRNLRTQRNLQEVVAKKEGFPALKRTLGEGNKARVSYSDALVDGSPRSEEYPKFVVKDGVEEVEIPTSLMEEVEPLWNNFIVGYFTNDVPHIGSNSRNS